MSWQIAIALHLLSSTCFALVYRGFAKGNPDKALLSTALMYLFTVSPAGIVYALFSGDVSFSFPGYLYIYLLIGGVLFTFSNYFAFRANSHIDAAQFSIIGNLRVVTTISVSSLVLGETLTGGQFMGVALLLGAAVYIASLKFNRKTFRLDRYTLMAVLSALLLGLAISNEKFLLGKMSFATYLIVGWGFQTLMMSLFAVNHMHRAVTMIKSREFRVVLWLGAFRTIAGFTLVYALVDSDNSSLVSGFTAYKTALVVVGSYLVLKETDHIRTQVAGTVLATIGLMLLV